MLDEKIYEEWDMAAFLARQGESQELAAFLRKHATLCPVTELDLAQLADLLEGKLRRSRGKPSKTTQEARRKNLILRAADGEPGPLSERLESIHLEQSCELPNFRVLAEIVRGDYKRRPGPYPGSRIKRGLDAWDIVKQVRAAQARLRREGKDAALPEAWSVVGKKIHKSEEWVRDEYYKMHRHAVEPPGPGDGQVLEGVNWVGDEHMKLQGEREKLSKPRRKRRKSD